MILKQLSEYQYLTFAGIRDYISDKVKADSSIEEITVPLHGQYEEDYLEHAELINPYIQQFQSDYHRNLKVFIGKSSGEKLQLTY